MSCQLPGAQDLEEFWRLIRQGASAITELPANRLDPDLYYSASKAAAGKSYARFGGVVTPKPSKDGFCPDSEAYDVAHRILLDVAAEACRDAGWDPAALPLRNAGVYVGHARTGPAPGEVVYSTHIEECVSYLESVPGFAKLPEAVRCGVSAGIVEQVRKDKARRQKGGKPFGSPGIAASLIARSFGLTGPGVVVDAACASSFVALALASGALAEGRVDMAIVGGASFSNWHSLVLFARAQALSATGSFPFDERADGFISSDGYAAVVVKTLARALADGDRIHGVIRGIGLSSDGRGKSLWAPRKEGQVEAIRRAWAGIPDPSRLDYVEAHGTSTQLGDATELQSLFEVLGGSLAPGSRVPIASVKANIGHTCETAGLAGLIKTLLAMRHGVIPPAANFETPAARIPWQKLPFFVPRTEMEWQRPASQAPRRAAVDAFGIGGLNVHLVVEEAPAAGSLNPASVPARRQARPEIAIIGAGAVFPGARTLSAFWAMVASGADPKSEVPAERWSPAFHRSHGNGDWEPEVTRGGFISGFEYDWNRHRIPPKQLETADPLQFMLLDAADQALEDAGYTNKAFDRRRTAVVVGTMFGGDFARQLTVALQYPEFERELEQRLRENGINGTQAKAVLDGAKRSFHQHKPMLRDETGSYSASTLASRIARTLDLMGGAFALDSEEASSAAALEAAIDLLRSGACDMVLCAGAQRLMDITVFEEYGLRGLLEGADGWLPAEGAGLVILKRLDDARRDGDRVRATLSAVRAVRTEGETLPVDSVARQMGHALGAAGMASLLAAAAPGGSGPATVTSGTSRGLNYEVDLKMPEAAATPRVAFLFPGQGSQYTGMLRELVAESPAAAAKLREIDATMAKLGYPPFSEIAWKKDAGLGTNIWLTQVSMLMADTLMYAALEEMGLRPDVVTGHSYGEIPALVAAGALTLEQAIRATRVRCERIEVSTGAHGVLMAVSAAAEVVERTGAGLPVHIAIRNAADQTIVGGERTALEQLRERLAFTGVDARLLAVPGPFHTPLLADAREPFARALDAVPVQPPRVPVLSSVTGRYVADPAEIRRNLAAQLDTPLDYAGVVRRLAADGINVFVEVGPKQVLTRLNQRILAGSQSGLTFLACDEPKRPGLAGIRKVGFAYESLGLRIGHEQAGPANQVTSSSSRHEILFFDATEPRRMKNRNGAPAVVEPEPEPRTEAPPPDEWATYLVNMICDQTGYPPEVVSMDADLEADLGLDSITRARLFLELADRFELGDIREQRLQDFHTLRDLVGFLRTQAAAKQTPLEVREGLKILRLRGTPYEMGLEHGRQREREIKAIIKRYEDLLGGNAGERADLKLAMSNAVEYFGETGVEELRGLADGCGLPLHMVAGYNLALMPEFLPGCSHFVQDTHGPEGLLHGINEDAPLSLMLQHSLAPAAIVRHPTGGIPHITFGLPGQFAGINGLNAYGLAVSSTSLLDQAAPDVAVPGRTQCVLVKEILERAESIDSAVEIARAAKRCGASSMLLSHQAVGRICYVEYAGDTIGVHEKSEGFTGSNHTLMLTPANAVPEHSVHRLGRLEALVSPNGKGSCTLEQAQAALRDRFDLAREREVAHPTMNTVRRVDNLLSVVLRPNRGEAWVAAGPKAESYERLDLRDLLDPAVMRRWVLRVVPQPLPAVSETRLAGPVLVLGENATAKALSLRLRAAGSKVLEIEDTDPEAALRALDAFWNEAPAPHLFLMCGRNARPVDILLPYLVVQRWMRLIGECDLLGPATLVAATSLGGDFGLSGRMAALEGGGLAGLVKALRREFTGLYAKVVDAAAEEPPERLAQGILEEVAARTRETETAMRMGRRSVVRVLRRRAVPAEPVAVSKGGAWVVTGGARGITACVARELGSHYGLNLHLIGRSPSAEIDFPARYHSCDVTDEAALSSVLERIRAAHGPIRGVVHGAGVEDAAPFHEKNIESVRATIGAKVGGARNLMELTRRDPLEAFLAFGSLSGRFGGHGQTDYSLASDMLAKLVQRFRTERPECASVVFHWPAWDDVGMAMRPASRAALERAGQQFMPPAEGVGHILAELAAGAPEGEVVIADGPGLLDLDRAMQPDLPSTENLPLLAGMVEADGDGREVSEIRFDPVNDVFLREHCFQGQPLLPGVVSMEALAEASQFLAGGARLTALRNVEIQNPLRFPSGKPHWCRVEARRTGDGAECRLLTEFRNRDGRLIDGDRVIARAEAEFGKAAEAARIAVPEALPWHPVTYPDVGPMIHGPSLRLLEAISICGNTGFARIAGCAAGWGAPRSGKWLIPAPVLDACLVACGAFALTTMGLVALPQRLGSVRLIRVPDPDEPTVLEFVFRERKDRTISFDFTLGNESGTPLIRVEDYQATTVGEGA